MNTAAAAGGRSTAVDLAAGTNMAAAAVDIDLVGYMGVGSVVEQPDCCSYQLQMMSEFADSVHQQIAIADQQEEEEVVVVEEVAIFEWWACVVSALAPLHPKP